MDVQMICERGKFPLLRSVEKIYLRKEYSPVEVSRRERVETWVGEID